MYSLGVVPPAGRWGIPDDVGEALVYYAGDEASFVTGVVSKTYFFFLWHGPQING